MRQSDLLTEETDKALSAFVDERNWLVHFLYKENHEVIHNDSRFELLCKRIERLEASCNTIITEAATWLEKWSIARGNTKEQLEKDVEKLISERRK